MTIVLTKTSWTENAFLTDCEQRSDGCLIMTPRKSLGDFEHRSMDVLERWAKIAPDRTLVARRGLSGEWIRISYAQMRGRVQRIAAGLVERGLSAQRPILILSGNSLEHMTLAFAAAWAGIPYCAISPAYSQHSSDYSRLRDIFELLTPGMVAAFPTAEFERVLVTMVTSKMEIVGDMEMVGGRSVTQLASLENTPTARLHAAHADTNPDSIVKFVLTSGSTGTPKAVITTERMICSNAKMLLEALPFLCDEPPVLVDWLPWNHTFGGTHNIGLVLFYGGTMYIDDGKPTAQGFGETLRNLREISPTVYFNVPRGFEKLATHLLEDSQLREVFYRQLRCYFFAAASLPKHVWDLMDQAAKLACGGPVAMLSSMGATETGPAVTFTTPSTARKGFIGLPAPGNVLKLVPSDGKLEFRVRSPSITPGYWRRPEQTAAAFDEEGFYCMGDAVRPVVPDDPCSGLMFDGRIAEDFKLASGTWVRVGPVRASLIAALAPLIQDVVIAGLDRDYLTAVLIPDMTASAAELRLAALPTYADLGKCPAFRRMVKDRLTAHAAANPASSKHVRRATLIDTALAPELGEVTEKGTINQRAVLQHRHSLVDAMHVSRPADIVIKIY